MMSGSRNLAASRYGVAPISVAGRFEVLGVAPHRRALGDPGIRIGAVREQRLHQVQIASQHRRMQRRVAAARGVRDRRPCRAAARATAPWPLWAASTSALVPSGSASFDVRAGRQQQPRGLDVADARGKQQRRAAAAQHGVVQLFAARSLRLLADDGLRCRCASGRERRRRARAAAGRRPDGVCAAAHISAV